MGMPNLSLDHNTQDAQMQSVLGQVLQWRMPKERLEERTQTDVRSIDSTQGGKVYNIKKIEQISQVHSARIQNWQRLADCE